MINIPRNYLTFIAIALLSMLLVGMAAANTPVPRKILALYKGSENRTSEINEIYQLAQLPLNNLGLVAEYVDAEGDLPNRDELSQYLGILTWFVDDQMKNVRHFRNWLLDVLTHTEIPVVIMGNFGALREYKSSMSVWDRYQMKLILQNFGLQSDFSIQQSDNSTIMLKDTAYFDYERKFTVRDIHYLFDIQSIDPRNRVLLKLIDGSKTNAAAVIAPKGGFIQTGAIYWQDGETGHYQWYLDPYQFFGEVFHCTILPVIDINSLGGYRTAFIHVDGDGFSTISKIDRWHLCAQLLQKRVLAKFPLPFSVSIIAAEVDSAFMGNLETIESARAIFRRENVEAASHGFAHPFDWRTHKLELDSIPNYQFNAKQEIMQSVRYIQKNLLPPAKHIHTLFWSGMCNPTASQIKLAEDAGWLQINGGGGKIANTIPSISNFAPPYAQVDDRFRINARISNEYEFTNLWSEPLDGFRKVIDNLRQTQQQKFSIPADIYFHFYSMELNESWKALKQVLTFAEHQNWNFMYASQYIRMVQDFIRAKIDRVSENEYVVHTSGSVRTIKFPNENRAVDLAASDNILGYMKQKGYLLVHLNTEKDHRIILTSKPVRLAHLHSFNRMVDYANVNPGEGSVLANGYGDFHLEINNMKPDQSYEIECATALPAEEYEKAKNGDYHSLSTSDQKHRLYAKSNGNGDMKIETFLRNRSVIQIHPASFTQYVLAQVKLWILFIAIFAYIILQFFRMKMKRQKNDLSFQ